MSRIYTRCSAMLVSSILTRQFGTTFSEDSRLWRAVLSSSSALTAFREVLVRVATGQLPESAAEALPLSKLTPLRKPGRGIRPVAAPSLLR